MFQNIWMTFQYILKTRKFELFVVAFIVAILFFYLRETRLVRKGVGSSKPEAIAAANRSGNETNSIINAGILSPNTGDLALQGKERPIEVNKTPAMQVAKVYEGKDVLCLNIPMGVYLLPRRIAVEITRKKTTNILLPKELTGCLAPGPIKFWVVDYDLVTQFPYRYYLEINTSIIDVKDFDPLAIDSKSYSEQANTIKKVFPIGIAASMVKVSLGSINIGRENFTFDNQFLIFGNKQNASVGPGVNVAKVLKSNDYLRTTFASPSHLVLKKMMETWDPKKNSFITKSSTDVGILNLEAAFYFQFKKRPNIIYQVDKEKKTKPAVPLISAKGLFPLDPKTVIVDLRPKKSARNFEFPETQEIELNADIKGAGNIVNVKKRMKSHKKVKRRAMKLYSKGVAANLEKLKGKRIVLVGLADGDPLVNMFVKALPADLRKKALILEGGFYPLVFRSYFYNEPIFDEASLKKVFGESELTDRILQLSF